MGHARSIPAWAFALVLCLALGSALALEQGLGHVGVIGFFGGAALLTVLLGLLSPAAPQAASGSQPLSGVGAGLGFASAVFFRTRYLWSVPSGYGFEALAFIFFARKLFDEGFPYIPYAWYAHTAYSYAIALALPFAASELVASRIAAASISILTVALLYICGRAMFGRQVAWIAVGLFGPAWWHLWASRNGYHQFVMPPFHLLFMTGVVAAVRDAKRWGFFLAGAALVGALHAYWGLYLLLPYAGLLFVYLLVWQRPRLWQERWRLGAAVLATLVGLIPLAVFFATRLEVFGYTTRAFTPQMSEATDLSAKLANNGWYILWALSGNVQAEVPYGAVVDPLVGAAALVGLALCLRWWRVSLAHAAVLLLFVINVAGLLATMVNYFYVTATMVSMYLFAAVALAETLAAVERSLGRFAAIAALAMMALLGWRSVENYKIFFADRILVELQSPFKTTGRAYRILETVAELTPTSTVFIARDEPGRDFAEEIFELGARIPSYSFMRSVETLDAQRVFFPPQVLVEHRPVVLLLPTEPYVQARLLPMLRRLYPNLTIVEDQTPEPYHSLNPAPVAMRITLPWADVERRFGLSWLPETALGDGLFLAPGDGEYEFRSAGHGPDALRLDGRTVHEGEAILLEAGPHRLQIAGWLGGGLGVDYRLSSGAWLPIDGRVVNTDGLSAQDVSPYLAHPGRFADYYYEWRGSLPVPATIRDAPVAPSGEIIAVWVDGVSPLVEAGNPAWRVDLPGPRDYRGLFDGQRLLAVDPNGALVPITPQGPGKPMATAWPPVDVAKLGARLLVLFGNGQVQPVEPAGDIMRLNGADGGPLLMPVAMRAQGDVLLAIDARAGEVLSYDAQGRLITRRVVPNLWSDSEVVVDGFRSAFLRRWRYGWRAYGSDGALLFHPLTRQPLLFSRNGEGLENWGLRHLQFGGEIATLVSPDGHVDVYERRRAAPP